MRHVELTYTLRPDAAVPAPAAPMRNPMMDVLHAVHERGSISAAARAVGLSYRHVWGLLRQWESELGHELLVWERGQAAVLSPVGQRLLMAERLAQARLGPQLASLKADLERVFSQVLDSDGMASGHELVMYASHDHALNVLQEVAAGVSTLCHPPRQRLHLDIRFSGSVDAIRALNEGRCLVAGFHTQPFAAAGSLSARTYKPLLRPGTHKIIGFARRSQGLIVKRGNPLRLANLNDVVRTRARLVNRAKGTGTRLLLEELMQQHGIVPADIHGFDHVEASHAATARAVFEGSADVGLGAEYAARAANLDFVPLTEERYLLVCLKSALETPALKTLLQILRSRAWTECINSLPGYGEDHGGQVAAMKRLLPWWD
ncbi:MAG: LysR family transcriptional regulator [Burkholderiales bacterium]|nr:MAG: LysR family transcriptional regulator [Burkholderiales bacterium]